MMINKRLIGTVKESKKYIALNVAIQWCSLAANVVMMAAISVLLASMAEKNVTRTRIYTTIIIAAAAVVIRFLCAVGMSKMSYLSSKAVKKTLREKIYEKLLKLGTSYQEKVQTSEVVQVAVEGVDQLETYFGAYLPQFFYAMIAPLTLFVILCFINVPSAVVLLICVPLIPVAIAAVQTWAKKLLSKYWGRYTALGDTFLENLQGLTTLKIYQADEFKHKQMNEASEEFRKITMKVLTMQLNSITIMDLIAYGVVCSKRLLNQAVGKSLRTHNLKPKKGAQVMRKNEKITALYERLSRDDFGKDDDQQRESNSISNQKAMLEEFAARQGFTNIVHFTDDGISGTCFDRPGFLAMMKEVEAGNVEYLCIKDMSRMGRDYLKVGQIMEILRQRGVRLIAINDGVDSARGDDDFTPFRNIMNEYYARDTSRKIRSTFQSKGKSGKHLTGTVIYGYLWNEARDQWLVDPEAADVVKRIFAMTIEGYGPYQIASKLKEEKILIPSAYLAQHGEGVNKNKTFKDVYGWGSSTICNILEKREYLGHTINFKTRKHFKDKKSHYVPEDEWTIFENTHEPIIDQQTFDLVQKIRGNVRRYPDGWGEAAPLTGLLYCADCGGKMYVHRTNNGKRISQYTCSQYSKVPVGKLCKTQHRINEDVVLSLVSEMLKAIAEYAKHDRAEFVRVVQEAQSSQQTAEVKKQRIRLTTAKQRVSELEVLLCKIYEDNILGKLSDSRYATLDAQYEKEQSELTAEISALEKAIRSYEKHEKDADRFIALIDKYENFDKLTIAMLNEFIEKILVHERDRKGSIQTTQEVEIYFNFVGRFVPRRLEKWS